MKYNNLIKKANEISDYHYYSDDMAKAQKYSDKLLKAIEHEEDKIIKRKPVDYKKLEEIQKAKEEVFFWSSKRNGMKYY